MTDREIFEEAVAWIDERQPLWFLGLEKLDLASTSTCICGQNGIRWGDVELELFSLGISHAFSSNIRFLEMWEEEIAHRQVPVPDLVPA